MLVEPKKSNIHGIGLFTVSNIESGNVILDVIGEVVKTDDLSDAFIRKGCWQGINKNECIISEKTPTVFRFINHSKKPNAFVDLTLMQVIAKIKIPKNTEITIDYDIEPMNARCRKLLGVLK
jgi:SET domain-containing protein